MKFQAVLILVSFLTFFALVKAASDEILSEYNVQGTYWDTQTDAGGCSMPSGNYLVLDALALGQATSLGQLAFQPKYCGQVFRVNCGGQSVNAVVASTCNFGTTTCGVDLIKRTWNYATGNKSPGVASCTVSLTSINPLPGSSPLCFYRPNSEFNNNYYKLLSVYNTAGKLVKSASLDGIAGSISSGNWYQFQAGSNQFSSSSTVSFTFEDGSKTSFALSACTRPSSVKIWTSDSTSIPQLSSTLPANTLTKTKTTTSSSSSATSAALLGDWVICTSSSVCSSKCCSSQYSSGVLKCTPGGSSCVKSTTSLFGDWESCTTSSQCTNNCCSTQYSNDGKLKCTPGGSVCVGSSTASVAKLGDWAFCQLSSDCSNQCCSTQYSGDGKKKCTPGGSICV